MIYNFHKKIGETMGHMLDNFKSEYSVPADQKVTYSGRLDPFASGEVIILTGEDVHKKDLFNKLDKVYSFSILFGVGTDTCDMLGVVKKRTLMQKIFRTRLIGLSYKKIEKAIMGFKKTYKQKYPAFSSYNVSGMPLWQHAREGSLPKIMPKHKVTIYDIEVFGFKKITGQQILDEVNSRISNMYGDFRQTESLVSWNEYLKDKKDKQFFLVNCRATVSSGTYIRQLCSDIAKSLCTQAVAYSINRDAFLK